jgi:predicted RNase H-like nuclease (RuvC/YqgF family)
VQRQQAIVIENRFKGIEMKLEELDAENKNLKSYIETQNKLQVFT